METLTPMILEEDTNMREFFRHVVFEKLFVCIFQIEHPFKNRTLQARFLIG